MSKTKNIPAKNYVLLIILIIVTVVATLYINAWIKTYKANKLSLSPFSGVVEEININEINLAFSETNEVILYVGYTNNQKVYEMEEKILKYIKEHEIVDKFMYINVTEHLDNDKYLDILKKEFSEVKDDIKEAPMLLYVKNGKAEEVVSPKDRVLKIYDIANINEKYELEN